MAYQYRVGEGRGLVLRERLAGGLRMSELTGPTRQSIDWEQHRLIIHGKGGPVRIAAEAPRGAWASAKSARSTTDED